MTGAAPCAAVLGGSGLRRSGAGCACGRVCPGVSGAMDSSPCGSPGRAGSVLPRGSWLVRKSGLSEGSWSSHPIRSVAWFAARRALRAARAPVAGRSLRGARRATSTPHRSPQGGAVRRRQDTEAANPTVCGGGRLPRQSPDAAPPRASGQGALEDDGAENSRSRGLCCAAASVDGRRLQHGHRSMRRTRRGPGRPAHVPSCPVGDPAGHPTTPLRLNRRRTGEVRSVIPAASAPPRATLR